MTMHAAGICPCCEGPEPVEEDVTINVFTYGILMGDGYVAATLRGYRLDYGFNAAAVEDPNGTMYGVLVTGLKPHELAAYDRIEGVDHERPERGYYRRERCVVRTEDGPVAAYVYVMNEHVLAQQKQHLKGQPVLDEFHAGTMAGHFQRVGHGPDAFAELERLAGMVVA